MDVIPYSHVAASDGRDPVPADRRVECGIVGSQLTSVEIGTLCILFLHSPEVGRLYDVDGNAIVLTDDVGDIETLLLKEVESGKWIKNQ